MKTLIDGLEKRAVNVLKLRRYMRGMYFFVIVAFV